jgi:alkanesulfonate monooxygenase SsuD/methylene tetrahydromethanopterin reductase-like flavin-dependent oxidoreductase (luciferase family)
MRRRPAAIPIPWPRPPTSLAAIGRRDGEAAAVLGPAVENIFGVGLDRMSAACMYGTPDRWVDTIGEFGEAGAQNVNTLLFSTDLARDVEIVVNEVLPQLAEGLVAV